MSADTYINLKITQASLNQTALDWPRNMANMRAAIDVALAEGSDILAFDELTLTGYEVNDDFQRTDNSRILEGMQDLADYANAVNPNLIMSFGAPFRVQMRDIPPPRYSFERVKDPLYDRLNLPFNVQALLSGGSIHAMTAKNNLYNDGRGYEKRYFNEWSMMAADRIGGVYGTLKLPLGPNGRFIQFGNPILHVTDGKVGFNLGQPICESKWVGSMFDGYPYDDSRYETDNMIPDYARYLGSKDGLILLNPEASPPAPNKIDQHVHLNKLASRYCNAFISTDGLGSSGSTFAQMSTRTIAQDGKIISYAPRMSFQRVATTTSTIRIKAAPVETKDKAHVILKHKFNNNSAPIEVSLANRTDPKQTWDVPENENRQYEEVMRNLSLWLFDYVRKGAGLKGLAEALSGGADSAFNSVMLCTMIHLGIAELGADEFCNQMKFRNKQKVLDAEKEGGTHEAARACLEDLLTGVYMGTNNSSQQTQDAARSLIEGGLNPHNGETFDGIGGKFIYRNIQDLVDMWGVVYAVPDSTRIDPAHKLDLIREISEYMHLNPRTTTQAEREAHAALLKAKYPEIERLMTAADGTVYENMQAQARDLIWVFAGKEGKMPIANPNKDEIDNGYTTPSGDEHGGPINPNGGLHKAFQLKLMRYLYNYGLRGVMPPVRAFGPILDNPPSAELTRPDKDGKVVQRDEDALQRTFQEMDVISAMRLYKRVHTENGARRLNASEVFEHCKQDDMFSKLSDNVIYNKVRMDYARWNIAQWKIHMAPIAPTLGSNVDHQTSQRTPNFSGRSRDELATLGIDLMFKWAGEEGLNWAEDDRKVLIKRTWNDEEFLKAFDHEVWLGSPTMDYGLREMYEKVKTKGWDSLFGPSAVNRPARTPLPN